MDEKNYNILIAHLYVIGALVAENTLSKILLFASGIIWLAIYVIKTDMETAKLKKKYREDLNAEENEGDWLDLKDVQDNKKKQRMEKSD